MKELYRYKVNKEEKKEVKTANEDGTFTISIVSEKTPVEVIVRKPSRKDREDMAMVYNAEFHRCLNAGISTEAALRRAFFDGDGDLISKRDLESRHELYKNLEALKLELQQKSVEDDKSKLFEDINSVCKKINEIEAPYQGNFNNSAEALATRKSLVWAALALTYLSEFERVFSGPTFESRLNAYYEMCDEEGHEFELGCFDRSYVFVERFLTGMAETKEDFELIEKELNDFFEKE